MKNNENILCNIKIKDFYKCFFVLIFFISKSHSQTITNKGAFITAQSGAFIRVNGSIQNDNAGVVLINGNGTPSSAELYVSQDVVNNATINADGYIRLLRNWIDNNTYSSTLGTVFMEGANQQLSGTSPTTFFNLTLDGSGVKTQTINKYVNGVLDLKSLELNTSTFGMFVQNPAINAILRSPALPESVQGFVSSANGGYLSRVSNSTGTYLFPVGSVSNLSTNVATATTTDDRYRPVEIVPNSATASSYTVRMANVNATTETFDRTLIAPTICATNPLFYHQINRSSGSSSVNLNVYYDPVLDGNWEGLSRWDLQVGDNLWKPISGSTTAVATSPFYVASVTNWSNFSAPAYILHNGKPVVTVDCAGPICSGNSQSITTSVTPNGSYTFSWSSNPSGFSSSTQNPNVSPTSTTTYTVTATNTVNNCQSDPTSCSLTVNQSPSINAISPP